MNQDFEAPSIEVMNDIMTAFSFESLAAASDVEAVYVAVQKSLDRRVAVRVFSPHLTETAGFKQAFDSTFAGVARMNHLNLVRVLQSGVADGMLFMVMEHVPSGTMAGMLQGQAHERGSVLKLMDACCDGLSHAHQHDIVHGALRPSSILLDEQGQPKIGGFGLLDLDVDRIDSELVRFIAPEVLNGSSDPDARSDVFSLGVMLFELLTGEQYNGDAGVPELPAGIQGAGLVGLLNSSTSADPARRPHSVEEFRRMCRRALSSASHPDVAVPTALKHQPVAPRQHQAPQPAEWREDDVPVAAEVVHRVGFNWVLLRNVIIIAILCYGIHLAWTRYKHEKQKRIDFIAEQQQAEEDAKRARIDAARAENQKREEITGNREPDKPDQIEDPGAGKVESTANQLVRLRQRLARGDRSEMPDAARRVGRNHYLFMDEPMTWPDAAWFAEQHGAHLVVPNEDAPIQWLRSEVMGGVTGEAWIGAARSGLDSWALPDGKLFKPSQEMGGDGLYVAADEQGGLHVHGAGVLRPFLMQWQADGRNPGALKELLQATHDSIRAGSPVYPPGTRAFGVRNYLYVSRPVDWQTAHDLARMAGGHLLVARGIAETFNIERMTDEIRADMGVWIGGVCREQQWEWVTGEPWEEKEWNQGAGPDAGQQAAVVYPGKGWQARDCAEPSSGFIIEWSPDAGLVSSR